MADLITWTTLGGQWVCGDSNMTGLRVVVFNGPSNSRVVAYCCNMNIDIDGDPQAYWREDDPEHIPLDSLGDACWMRPGDNTAAKAQYEQLKRDLPQWKSDFDALPADTDAATKKALEKKIKAATQTFAHLSRFPSTAKNYEKKFWEWCGVTAYTPAEAAARSQRIEGEERARSPVLAKDRWTDSEQFEDVYGRYPVCQTINEPGRGFYFVSHLSVRVNGKFPEWDQRAYVQPDARQVEPYVALSTLLTNSRALGTSSPAALDFNQYVLGLRLDNGASVTMKFLDSPGAAYKVGECSLPAFAALGGAIPQNVFPVANRVNNNFLVLFIAVPVTSEAGIGGTFANFSQASNANDFPAMLAFVAEETVRAAGTITPGSQAIDVGGADPMAKYVKWRDDLSARRFAPSTYDRVKAFLMTKGYTPPPRDPFTPH